MRERSGLSDAAITAVLQAQYTLPVAEVSFLPLGHDADSSAYRVRATDGAAYFLKVRREAGFHAAALHVPHALHAQGVPHLVPPRLTTTGALWVRSGSFMLSLYPFIDGAIGGSVGLTAAQWRTFGYLMRRVHDARLPPAARRTVPDEPFVPTRRAVIGRLETAVENDAFANAAEAAFAAAWRARRADIRRVVAGADALGQALRHAAPPHVLCHADMHPWNLLVSDNELWLIDWDETIWAPKERDLMFVIGGIGGDGVGVEQTAAFLEGYGREAVDQRALAYYRYAWAVQDIAAYGEQLFFRPEFGAATRHEAVRGFRNLFKPGNIIHRALGSAVGAE